ncbi:uncharacterized protein VTP21DRAFT_6775 [Calcarisporiella thermophila]|uniref:uncharacterized protein n=1 Tax=Calcarisporiella thermophila TaxID=911321 RepID=UPI0037432374
MITDKQVHNMPFKLLLKEHVNTTKIMGNSVIIILRVGCSMCMGNFVGMKSNSTFFWEDKISYMFTVFISGLLLTGTVESGYLVEYFGS